jgi:hypothetical protein
MDVKSAQVYSRCRDAYFFCPAFSPAHTPFDWGRDVIERILAAPPTLSACTKLQ